MHDTKKNLPELLRLIFGRNIEYYENKMIQLSKTQQDFLLTLFVVPDKMLMIFFFLLFIASIVKVKGLFIVLKNLDFFSNAGYCL